MNWAQIIMIVYFYIYYTDEISVLHVGHVDVIFNHVVIHSAWYVCPQLSNNTVSLFGSVHIEHFSPSPSHVRSIAISSGLAGVWADCSPFVDKVAKVDIKPLRRSASSSKLSFKCSRRWGISVFVSSQ